MATAAHQARFPHGDMSKNQGILMLVVGHGLRISSVRTAQTGSSGRCCRGIGNSRTVRRMCCELPSVSVCHVGQPGPGLPDTRLLPPPRQLMHSRAASALLRVGGNRGRHSFWLVSCTRMVDRAARPLLARRIRKRRLPAVCDPRLHHPGG